MIVRPTANGFEVGPSPHPKVFRVPGLGDDNQGGLVGYFGQA
jgi:hypothetical protein